MKLIDVICRHSNFRKKFVVNSSPHLTAQLQNMWFFITILVMRSDSTYPLEWRCILSGLSENTPLMVPRRESRALIADLGTNTILRGDFSDLCVAKVKQSVLKCTSGKVYLASDAKLLPFSVQVYLLTIYKIESMRMNSLGDISFISAYLTDPRLIEPGFFGLIEILLGKVLRRMICDSFYAVKISKVLQREHISNLVFLAASRIPKVRNFATVWIKKLLAAVPNMVWDHESVFLIFDIILHLDALKQEGTSVVDFAHLKYFDLQETESCSKEFLGMAIDWLKTALSYSSSETLGVMQTYLVVATRRKTSSLLDDHSDLMELYTLFSSGASISSAIIRSPSKHARFLGQINGMILMDSHNGLCFIVSQLSQTEIDHRHLQEGKR